MYHIRSFCHSLTHEIGAHGFCIDLAPEFKERVALSGLTQDLIDSLIENCGRVWLDAAGYDAMYDAGGLFDPHDLDPEYWQQKKHGLNAHRLYEPRTAIRVSWGEWGPEHITIPGNGCGLDLDLAMGSPIADCKSLSPHNVDAWQQKYLLTIVFLEIAEHILWRTNSYNDEKKKKETTP